MMYAFGYGYLWSEPEEWEGEPRGHSLRVLAHTVGGRVPESDPDPALRNIGSCLV